MPLNLVLIAIAIVAISGIPGIFMTKKSSSGQITAACLMVLGSIIGLLGAWMGLFSHDNSLQALAWPAANNTFIGLDPLSAFFLIPVFLTGGLGSLFGLGYWKQKENPHNAQKLQFFWGFLAGGMSLLIIGRHALAFLLGWEIMALSAFFLVGTDDETGESRKSALVYLISAHIGTLLFFGFFALWYWATGSFDLRPIPEGTVQPLVLHVLFFLGLIGFGLKAGMMPFHFWLPGAHANAPSHVSAMLSGVLLKMGIYGLVRMTMLLPDPPALWGIIILTFGVISSLFGVVFALSQHDIKRLLAYHSIENIGIILIGLGVAYLGMTYHKPDWVALGMAGCLLHVWNHSLFKTLLFYGAGSVIHGTHLRNIDVLGGLSKPMPWTALFFLIGSVAISGIPPLNGFVSEFIIFLGLFRPAIAQDGQALGILLSAPVLAMVGALAAACFVKVYSAVFLGTARTNIVKAVHESPLTMLIPMAILAFICAVIGLVPALVSPILESVTGQPGLAELVPFQMISWVALGLLLGILLIVVWSVFWNKSRKKSVTWDCGYAEPTSRMQYTASSFGNGLTSMFGWLLRPVEHKPRLSKIIPDPASLISQVNEVVLDRMLVPGFHKIKSAFAWFNRFQQGQTQMYVLYILIAVILLFVAILPIKDWLSSLFIH